MSGWLNPWLARARPWERLHQPLRRMLEPIFGVADEVHTTREHSSAKR